MIKTAVLASAICFAFAGSALAQSATSKIPCDEPGLTKMKADIDAMTDKGRQAEAMKSWEAANTAFKANNMDECNARIGEGDKSMNGTGANTTTQ
jgi:hypothetical protein